MDRYLETLEHEELLVRRGRRSGLYCIVAVHSTARGPSLGGCRLWAYDDSRAALRDGLRLSRAMTFKAACADLPLGGGKGVIMLGPADVPLGADRRRAVLRDFGDAVEAVEGRYLTAEDVGTSMEDMAVIAESTRHVTGLPVQRGGSGDPSPWTALGVESALRVACEHAFGSASVAGRTVSVIGLGHVGGDLARRLAQDGARLVVADVDERKRALAEELGATWLAPGAALTADVDVVAPCALGGVLDHDSVPALRCRIVCGAANNQLAADELADLLAARGILWVPDFVANAGGIINIAVELEPEGYAAERAEARVRAVGDTLRTVLTRAEAAQATPLAGALELARRRLTEAGVGAAAA